ncbi:MAG: type I-C CRISPR-associated protein Cas8c/Csd1 [Bacteroidales bacterium]|nr:type I-C CRISPR-associated protein Cas8c/Csd1 [Bacteroidales bacterium]
MILKALYDYYHRSGDLPPMGFEKIGISYVIVIDNDGNFKRIDPKIKDKKPIEFCVHQKCRKSSDVTPNILWDNAIYILGIESNRDEHQKFVEKCKTLLNLNPDRIELRAICAFYENGGIEQLSDSQELSDIQKNPKVWISFQIQGELDIIPLSCKDILLEERSNNDIGVCLITGEETSLVKTAGKFMLEGNNAHIVTFQKDCGYDSYGKTQCYNAPIGKSAEFATTTALKTLTGKDSRNKYRLSENRTFVFWASNNNETSKATEESFFMFINNEYNPNTGLQKVIEVFKSVWSGKNTTKDKDLLYLLGLAPVNKGRHAVVYWNECTVMEFAGNILRHFEDMEIVDGRKEQKPYMGIYSMLSTVTLGGKQSDVQPNLPEAVLKSIVQGIPYPYTLFSSCIRRIRAEVSDKVNGKLVEACSIQRIAIIKAYLNRIKDNNKKIQVMLDKENTNEGYLCGRLFAVLDKIQYAANGQNSIRSSYMNAASSTPAAVFARIMSLSNSHIVRLKKEKPGLANYFEEIKSEILEKISANGFPSVLPLQDQGRFFVGYYHQKNDKKENVDNE